MKITLKTISYPELTFKLNPVKPSENNKFEIKPRFERRIRVSNENPHIYIVDLICSILSNDSDPKPFNLVVNTSGVFDVEDIMYFNEKQFALESTKFLFPYVRSAIANLTTIANIAPMHLPILSDGILFPEDRVENDTND